MSRDLRIISLALFGWGLGETLFIYTQTLYLEQLGADPIQIGSALGLFAAAMTVTHIPAGILADRFGRRSILVAGWVIGFFAVLIMYAAQSLTPFIIGLALYGFTGFVIAPMSSYMAAARGEWPVMRALTTAYAMFNIGGVIGPLIAWALGEYLSLRATYGWAAGIFALSTIAILWLRPQPLESASGEGRMRALADNRAFWVFLAFSSLTLIGGYLSWPLTPNYLQSVRAIPQRTFWLLGAFNSMGMVAISLWLGNRSPKWGMLLIQSLLVVSILLLWQMRITVWFALAYFLAGGYRTLRSLISAQAQSLVEPANMGLAFGVVETTMGLILILLPPLAGVLYQETVELPYIVSLGILGMAITLSALGTRRFKPVALRIERALNRHR